MNPSSIIAVDKYEILYASAPEWDKENNIADQKKVIQYLNNASVQYGNIDLKINIYYCIIKKESRPTTWPELLFLFILDIAKIRHLFKMHKPSQVLYNI